MCVTLSLTLNQSVLEIKIPEKRLFLCLYPGRVHVNFFPLHFKKYFSNGFLLIRGVNAFLDNPFVDN